MADGASLERISIPGPTLASLLQRFASAPGGLDGLLFGRVSRLPPPDPTDDSPSPFPSVSTLTATLTGFISPASFSDPLGRADHRPLRFSPPHPGSALLGWFSARRRSPLRPSMRELSVSFSLHRALAEQRRESTDAPAPLVFLLLSSSAASAGGAVHTHDYRAFVLRCGDVRAALVPRPLRVVNVGPAFRAQYSSFSPELAALPWVPCRPPRGARGEHETEERGVKKGEQSMPEGSVVEGFGVERLGRLAGPGLAELAVELEDLYGKMLATLEELARLVEKSSAKVLEQENRNLKLRSKIAGLE